VRRFIAAFFFFASDGAPKESGVETPHSKTALASQEILMKRWMIAALLVLGSTDAGQVAAMGFPSWPSPPLRTQIAQASAVIDGTVVNSSVPTETNDKVDRTEFHIKRVLKMAPFFAGTKVVQLPPDRVVGAKPCRLLIFFDVFQGKAEAYFGIPVTSPALLEYVQEVALLKPKDRIGILSHAYRYLDHSDPEIAEDAWREFYHDADWRVGTDYRTLAGSLSADTIAGWLRDPKIPDLKLGLYAQLLGHCGGVKHAQLLRKMLDSPMKEGSSRRTEGLLVGYTLLQPQEGCAAFDAVVADSSRAFADRYGALRAIRYFWETRPDVVSQKELRKLIGRLLEQSDIADLAIADLRKWGQWQMADQVMALKDKPSPNTIPIVRWELLRFALCCPKNAAAVEYVEQIRREDPTKVEEAEELLRLENAKE
jgi:hypothetical protein